MHAVASVDWNVVVKILTAIGVIITALYSRSNHKEIKSPNGTRTGKAVSEIKSLVKDHADSPPSSAHAPEPHAKPGG